MYVFGKKSAVQRVGQEKKAQLAAEYLVVPLHPKYNFYWGGEEENAQLAGTGDGNLLSRLNVTVFKA